MTEQTTSSRPWYKKWWAITLFIFFGLIIISSLVDNDNSTNQTNTPAPQKQEEQSNIESPQYSVLDKTEHISTRMSDTEASYFGGVLIEEDVMGVSPEEFIEIARQIVANEGLDYSASFYSTEEAFRANTNVYVPKENKESLEQLGGLESNKEYMPQSEIDRLLDEGYIGKLEDDEFTMSPSSAYYQLYREDSNKENDLIVK